METTTTTLLPARLAECRRGFMHYNEAWYSKNIPKAETLDEVMIGFYHPEGGTSGEFAIRWTSLGGKSTPRLEVFSDAWLALVHFSDVVVELGRLDGKDASPREILEMLRRCGVADMTDRHAPAHAGGPTAKFMIDDRIQVPLGVLLAENAHDSELCVWMQAAKIGESLGGGAGARIERVA